MLLFTKIVTRRYQWKLNEDIILADSSKILLDLHLKNEYRSVVQKKMWSKS